MDAGTIVVSALGSLAGGWLGVTLAVRRLRAERALERQLQWHEDMADILHRLAAAINLYTTPDETLGAAKLELRREAFTRLYEQLDRFAIHGQKAELYATKATRIRIRSLIDQLKALTAGAASEGSTEESFIAFLKRYRGTVQPILDTRKWATDRKPFPDVDVMRAGGWKSVAALKRYQQSDSEAVLAVVRNGRKRQHA